MDWLLATMLALLDSVAPKPVGLAADVGDRRAVGIATEARRSRDAADAAVDAAVIAIEADIETMRGLLDEVGRLNREVVELTARNVVIVAQLRRLEAQHQSDRAHIRDLIAELVRRDYR